MFSYIAFLYGGVPTAGERALKDGESLAWQCLDKLKEIEEKPEQFPPRLLILLASPAYLDQPKAAQLIAGIHQTFAAAGFNYVPLVGCSVQAVFFDNKIHEEGALLVCLASRLLEAKVAAAADVCRDPAKSIDGLLKELELEPAKGADPNPVANRMLLTFFPGHRTPRDPADHPIDELHRALRKGVMNRIPIVGGVSCWKVPEDSSPALQFAGRHVYTDAIVSARIASGTPIGVSLAKGLKPTGQSITVTKLSEDGTVIEEFLEGTPSEALKVVQGVFVLSEVATDSDLVMAAPKPGSDRSTLFVLRDFTPPAALQVMKPEPKIMLQTAVAAIEDSMRRIRIENPIGCLSLKCRAHFLNRKELGLNIEWGIEKVREYLNNSPYVGGFFGGEAGTDETGRSVFGNWNVANVVFGDEMRERTPLHLGFETIKKHGPSLTQASSLEEVIDTSLELVFDAGFPGAMISILVRDQDGECIVIQRAKGLRFENLARASQRRLEENNLLSIVARKGKRQREPQFVPDARLDERCRNEASVGIISQCVIPLLGPDRGVAQSCAIGVLQVDLGDASFRESLHETEKQVLGFLEAGITASLNHVLGWEQVRIARALDSALARSMSFKTVEEGLEHYIRAAALALRADMGHARLADREKHELTLVAGVGPYYEVARAHRSVVDFQDRSPTCQTFLDGQVTVVNDARTNNAHRIMRERPDSNAPLTEALRKVGSYANVAFKDEAEVIIGVLDVASHKPWFFTPSQVESLADLGHRAGFLVEHLKRKEAGELARSRLEFLLRVGPHLTRIRDIGDATTSLESAVRRFRKASHADVASLFLWDDDAGKLVLRAQDGWANAKWVGAARYEESEGWTGSMALEHRPRYIPDLREYKKKTNRESIGPYANAMFGSKLTDAMTVEAIGLPLKVGDARLGVLTLHRFINQDSASSPTGFVTTDTDVLQEAADHMAALVSALTSHREAIERTEKQKRRSEVVEELAQPPHGGSIEADICNSVVSSLRAEHAEMYLTSTEINTGLVCCARSDRRSSGTTRPSQPDALILNALHSKDVVLQRRKIREIDPEKPEEAVVDGLPQRASIPLWFEVEKRLYGIIDVHWDLNRWPNLPLWVRPDRAELRLLGHALAGVYRRHMVMAEREEARRREEQSRFAVQAMGAMVFQSAHRLMNLVKDLRAIARLISGAPDEDLRTERIAQLSDTISAARARIDRPMKVARRMSKTPRSSPQARKLRDLLIGALEGSTISRVRPRIEVPPLVIPDELIISMDAMLIEEAFLNIIHNAIKAMPNGGALTVRGERTKDGRNVSVAFADTGEGMSEKEIRAALSGFFNTRRGTGVGVLIASTLVQTQGGTLDIKSVKGSGTTVVVTLPLTEVEGTNALQSVSGRG
jgi:signal transduction histidine kinase